ncbi:uncharacterized protein M421DRAFT_427110 [Didymella exigua CBS 183.55]|uniref:Uncharacterized protein n=1 Tax=Didymella exigua CBS 183.55 TaxID=1150837 RepID=A0A6A5R3M6_9PLEO|nr:uncharacterized protein M421DRAFT_427110 [Didymella exigua CBS 183.55]KAF1922252.1 hypothetical protein M421DRAFT_427110 [Didymella exigua CBS 183.55]
MLQECLQGLWAVNASAGHRTDPSLIAYHCQVEHWLGRVHTKYGATAFASVIVLNSNLGSCCICNLLRQCDAIKAGLHALRCPNTLDVRIRLKEKDKLLPKLIEWVF